MSQVFASLLTTPGCEAVRAATIDAFICSAASVVLFLTGDTTQRPEASDVAVALREIMRGPDGQRARVGIVDRRDEEAMMRKFGVVVLPAVVLIRDGKVLEIIARIRDWPVYTQAFARLVAPAVAAAPAEARSGDR
jgi:hydrogenase-1 operon protein HyaE